MRHNRYSVGRETKHSPIAKVLLLGRSEVEELLNMGEALNAVERSFSLKAEGRVLMPPKLYLDLPEYHGDFRAMPAYIEGSAGLKWVSVYPGNRKRHLLSVVATIILCDPDSGYPLAIMDGTYITDMRTGAAGGVAVKYLARRDSSIIGMIGAGKQARTQLLAISEVLPGIKEVKVFDQYRDAALRYAQEMRVNLNLNIRPAETIEEAAEADIVVTTTPSRTPIVKKHHIKPGTHINAIGADAKGKQELESDLLRGGKIIVDEIEQASHSGEINVPLCEGLIKVEEIYGTLGEVVVGTKKGRESDAEITIFDSTGLAIQDIICAKLVYEKCRGSDVPAFELF
ncbi:MAG: Delta(1)-pyrroline-2-carboxylate reductase [Dehalococcoidia bacterium]|nr:Delta(1)-pyrroline-2-carboxylate reductase [Chloroflexota bacterium]